MMRKKTVLKRIAALAAAASLLLSAVGCAKGPEEVSETPEGSESVNVAETNAAETVSAETEVTEAASGEAETVSEKPSATDPAPETTAEEPAPAETGKPGQGASSMSAHVLASPTIPQSPRHEQYDANGWTIAEKAQPGSEYRDVEEMLQAQAEEYQEISRTLPDFYASTIGEILGNAEGKNVVYSPLNVYLALSMLAEISDGNSRAQILELLGADSIETLRETAKSLWHSNYCDDGETTTTLANSLWLSDELSFRESTVQRLADDYYASVCEGRMGSSELNQMLQDWLNDNTGHMLEESAEGVKTNPDTILALASAIYFKAAWENKFEESATKKAEIFHAGSGERRCDYLVSDESGAALFMGAHFTAYGRPMKDGNTMWFFLPEEGMRPEELSKDPEFLQFLQSDPRTDFSDRIQYCTLHAEIPKFDVNSDLDLIRTLQSLGVSDVFSFTDSDFSQILTDGTVAAVSQMQHSARVRIDEEGCEAAAFTVIMLEKAMYMEQERAAFILDRPFIFAIRGASGAALFTGIVNEPGETSF